MLNLKERIIEIIRPLIVSIAKDINDLNDKINNNSKSTITVSNTINNNPSSIGELAIVNNEIYISVNTTSPSDWKCLTVYRDWKMHFSGAVKIAEYTTTNMTVLDPSWRELRIEFKVKNSSSNSYATIYNDIKSSIRKAYSLGSGLDIIIEIDGGLKCLVSPDVNTRILSIYWR